MTEKVYIVQEEYYPPDRPSHREPVACFSTEDTAKEFISRKRNSSKFYWTPVELDPDF